MNFEIREKKNPDNTFSFHLAFEHCTEADKEFICKHVTHFIKLYFLSPETRTVVDKLGRDGASQ